MGFKASPSEGLTSPCRSSQWPTRWVSSRRPPGASGVESWSLGRSRGDDGVLGAVASRSSQRQRSSSSLFLNIVPLFCKLNSQSLRLFPPLLIVLWVILYRSKEGTENEGTMNHHFVCNSCLANADTVFVPTPWFNSIARIPQCVLLKWYELFFEMII